MIFWHECQKPRSVSGKLHKKIPNPKPPNADAMVWATRSRLGWTVSIRFSKLIPLNFTFYPRYPSSGVFLDRP